MKLSNIYRENQTPTHQYLILSDINFFKKILLCFCKMSRNCPFPAIPKCFLSFFTFKCHWKKNIVYYPIFISTGSDIPRMQQAVSGTCVPTPNYQWNSVPSIRHICHWQVAITISIFKKYILSTIILQQSGKS